MIVLHIEGVKEFMEQLFYGDMFDRFHVKDLKSQRLRYSESTDAGRTNGMIRTRERETEPVLLHGTSSNLMLRNG